MTDRVLTRRRTAPLRWRVLPIGFLIVTAAVVVAACSGDDDAATTTTSTTTTAPGSTTTPSTTEPPGSAGSSAADRHTPLARSWTVQVGGAGNDALAALTGRDDAVVAVGSTDAGVSKPTVGGTDVLAVTVAAADGAVRATSQAGSAGSDAATAVAGTESGSLICGSTDGSLGGDVGGGTDGYCTVMSVAGTINPATQDGGRDDDRFTGVSFDDEAGHGYLVGSTRGLFPGAQDPTGGGLGEGDVLFSRIDDRGERAWTRQFGSDGTDRGTATTIAPDGDGVVIGTTDGVLRGTSAGGTDGFVARFDQSGNPRWLNQFGSNGVDLPSAVALGGDAARGTETIEVTGSTTGTAGGPIAGASDVIVASFASGGDRRWLTQTGSAAADVGAGIVVDGSTTYVAGTTAGTMTAAEGQTGDPVAAVGARDAFLAAFDTETGALLWVTQFGSPGNDDVSGLTRTEDGHLILSGTTDGQVGETPSAGGTDGFLAAFELPSSGGASASKV